MAEQRDPQQNGRRATDKAYPPWFFVIAPIVGRAILYALRKTGLLSLLESLVTPQCGSDEPQKKEGP